MTVYETTNHQTIYHWATARGLYPACVRGSPDRIRLGGDDSANPGEDLVSVLLPVGNDAARVLAAVAAELDRAGIAVNEMGVRLASLDEVFLTLTAEQVPA